MSKYIMMPKMNLKKKEEGNKSCGAT